MATGGWTTPTSSSSVRRSAAAPPTSCTWPTWTLTATASWTTRTSSSSAPALAPRSEFYVKGTNYTKRATLDQVEADHDTVAALSRLKNSLDAYLQGRDD